ncbi:hypothetical protein DJ013_09380 [Arcticibacterium luteifluviistationis]|uniref:Uncharacterized protein n=2 Tax=Arcticibacterium luteifluviistationis TaxID=1784714 RepID=A0A2Z4GB68_9BACT|nr:hypothetical protein DJ013_09380 [Arcticibacterium luteifluviistationis]
MEESIKNIHLAAQYLAAAGKSFLSSLDDDSQSNLAWNAKTISLESRDLGNGMKLTFSLENGFLTWLGTEEKLDLKTHSHQEILTWLTGTSTAMALEKTYAYAVSYELDYPPIESNYKYSFETADSKVIAEKFTLAQKGMESFLKTNNLTSEIRVWPHHFDIGIYTNLSDKLFLGAGLAIPDSLESDLYFYASGYNDGSVIVTKNLPKLSVGSWHPDWNGGTLKSKGVSEDDVKSFLNQAKNAFKENV